MKKSLLALAVAGAFAAPAMAQSSVTLFGAADVAVQQRSASGGGSQLRLGSSGLSSSAVGFRGTEDLGGGMRAEFWFEGDVAADSGSGLASTTVNNQTTTAGAGAAFGFNRRSTVALAGSWGEVRLGRDFVPTFRNHTGFDPFGTLGAGAATNMIGNIAGNLTSANSVRASNMIQYFSPNFNGFQATVAYAMGENNSNAAGANAQAVAGNVNTKNNGNMFGIRLGYAAGPLSVAYAYNKTTYVTGSGNVAATGITAVGNGLNNPIAFNGSVAVAGIAAAQGTFGDYTVNNLGGSYNFGVATVMAQYNTTRFNTTNANTPAVNGSFTGAAQQRDWLLGANIPVGAGNIRASYINSRVSGIVGLGTSTQWALGYVHNLSRRTALYVTYATINNSGNATNGATHNNGVNANTTGGGRRSSGYDIGLRHSF
jgi:predicted porin